MLNDRVVHYRSTMNPIMEVNYIASLFSEVKVQTSDQSGIFLFSGIPKEYDDLFVSVQLIQLLVYSI